MARQQIVVFKDDLDGTEDSVKPVRFGLDGATYEIDLGPANHKQLRELLAPFIDAARKDTSRSTRPARATIAQNAAATDHKAFNARVREWAAENGRQVKPRGRVPDKVVVDYRAAGGR